MAPFTIWERCFRGETDERTGFDPNTAFKKQANGKLGVCEDDAWVKAFRHRYKRNARDRQAATQILEYLCEKYEEKQASIGTYFYEKYITKCCVNRGCEALGYCEGKSATRFRPPSIRSTHSPSLTTYQCCRTLPRPSRCRRGPPHQE